MTIAIARKDKLAAGYNGNLESVKVFDNAGEKKVNTTNGVFVVVEGLIEGREVYKARLAELTDVASDILFIHNSEVMYDERKDKLEDFFIEADKVARAYRLHDGDIVTLTVDLFATSVAVGDKLVAHTAGKLGKEASVIDSAKVIFEVIEDAGNELHATAKAFAVKIARK